MVETPSPRQMIETHRTWKMVPQNLMDLCRDLTGGVKPWPLYVHGPPGVGKSRFGLCFADIVPGSLVWQVETISGRAFRDEKHWEVAATAPLIVLDELGTRAKPSEYEYASIKRFADLRDRGDGRVAVYISNLDPAALAFHYDDRIASRLLCGTIYHFDGPDQRFARQAVPA